MGEGVRAAGKPSMNETTNLPRTDGARVEGRFGVGEGVRAAGSPSTNEATNLRRTDGARVEVVSTGSTQGFGLWEGVHTSRFCDIK